MKLYTVKDEYINFLRKYVSNVYDNKEDVRVHSRKYLGIVLKVSDFYYYIPMSSPKKSDYDKCGNIRKSIPPIVRLTSKYEQANKLVLKGTLRISNMIPVPKTELIEYEVEKEKDKTYKDLVKKEIDSIEKNEKTILRFANAIYLQKVNHIKVSYYNSLLDYKYLEELCMKYEKRNQDL